MWSNQVNNCNKPEQCKHAYDPCLLKMSKDNNDVHVPGYLKKNKYIQRKRSGDDSEAGEPLKRTIVVYCTLF